MKNLSLIYVQWKDHHFASHWQTENEVENVPTICHSIGWLLKEDDAGLSIIGTCTDDGDVGNCQYILKSCIINRKPLAENTHAAARKARNGKQADRPTSGVCQAGASGPADRIVHGVAGESIGDYPAPQSGKKHAV